MPIIIIGLTAVVTMIAVAATPMLLSASSDPVGFIAKHKGGTAPNYYIEETAAEKTQYSLGSDGYEYIDDFSSNLFSIDSRLEALVPKDDYLYYTDELFAGAFDFNQRSFCRYFGITEEQYKEAISVFSNYEIYGETGKYIVDNYPRGIFGTYSDFLDVFYRKDIKVQYATEECIPGENCPHTYTYHTISGEMIELVGNGKYAEFKEKYYGTEDFNILNFIDFFSLSEEEVTSALANKSKILPLYNVKILFSDEKTINDYFYIK